MYNEIKKKEDIKYFLETTNYLHDGCIIGVQYEDKGITKIENRYYHDPSLTKLTLKILVTSIWDAVVEIEFQDLYKWQIKDDQSGIIDTQVTIDKNGWIIWTDGSYHVNKKGQISGLFAQARTMRWRIEENK